MNESPSSLRERNSQGTPILDAATAAEVRRLQLRGRRNLTMDLLGEYRSAFRGSGLIFTDLREYEPGDDIKHIHWKASARTGRVYVKSYDEERRLRVVIALDTSHSLQFGVGQRRLDRTREFCALIALLTQQSQDALGLALMDTRLHFYLEPRQYRAQASRVLATLCQRSITTGRTDLANCFSELHRRCHKPSIMFLISDFVSGRYEQELRMLSHRHDVVCVMPARPSVQDLRGFGLVQLIDPETGAQRLIDTSSTRAITAYQRCEEQREQSVRELCQRVDADILVLRSTPLHDLKLFLERRRARQRSI